MNSECSICYDEPTHDTCTLSCNHNFCEKCIVKWLEINTNCPMCRHEISDDEAWEKYLIHDIKNHDNNEAKIILKWFFKSILDLVLIKRYFFIGKIIIFDFYYRRNNGDPYEFSYNTYSFYNKDCVYMYKKSFSHSF